MHDGLQAGIREKPRHRFDGTTWRQETSQVVEESPVTLFVNGSEYVTAAVTSIDLKDWVVGFLAGEQIISRTSDISIFQWWPDDNQIWVRVPGFHPQPANSRYLGSCCGQSRPGFFNPSGIAQLPSTLTLQISELQETFARLSAWSRGQHSGGLHMAGLAQGGALLLARADVGRHNALDKLYGATLREQPTAFDKSYVLFSGRLSAEIVWKVRTMGVQAIVSNAAPTSLGIELADTVGITLIGFLRDSEMSVFSHPSRLTSYP